MIDEGIRTCKSTAIVWRLLQPSWSSLPFEANAFDAIVASSVFEYVQSVDAVFAECQRTLKPGGCVILTAPNPQHYVRKLESLFRPAAVAALRSRVFEVVPRIGGYLSYLDASQNRMSAAAWKQAAACGGLIAGENWLEAESPLMLLRFAKTIRTS
jgi:ubiquinone/menaquinone biosynthesis C-methylase UbiE